MDFKKKKFSTIKPPKNLFLHSYSQGCKFSDVEYLICGGLNEKTKIVTKKTFLYYADDNTAVELMDMISPRY